MLFAGATIGSIIIAGGLLVISLKQLFEKIDGILKKENLTDHQKNGAIGLLSALVLIGNVFAIVKAGSEAAVVVALFLMNIILAFLGRRWIG